MPKISVITACYNHGKYIHEMLDTVLSQSFQGFEVIIVNDGSTDNTKEILDQIEHKQVRVYHSKNKGPSLARNLAIEKAHGEIIMNLDADNTIAPTFLEKCVRIFDENPNAGIVYSDLEYFGEKTGPFALPDFRMEEMLITNCIDGNACFRKSDWQQTKGYSDAFKYNYEDFDFWLSILELGREVYKIKEPLVFYRTFSNPAESRSARCGMDKTKVMESIVVAFQRHKTLYASYPKAWEYCEKIEKELSLQNPSFNPNTDNPFTEKKPVFSIITPTGNRPQLLKRAIQSVLSQSFSDFEQVIVDDTNNIENEQLVKWFNDDRLRYISHEKPLGAGGAYNTGMKYARGTYLNVLDDDDEYLPGILEKIIHTFKNTTPEPGFVWTGITRVQDLPGGEEHILTQVWPTKFASIEDGLQISTAIGNGYGMSIKRNCIAQIGEYDPSLTTGQDTDLLIRLSKKFEFRTVPEVLVKIHHHGKGQLTDLKRTELRWNCYRRIMERHLDFLLQYWKVIHIHSLAYLSLCYKLKKKNAGRKFIWQMMKKYPFKKLLYQDFWCYERFGTDYNTRKLSAKS